MSKKIEEFKLTEDGLFCDGKYLCRYIEVIAFIRDIENENWKRRVRFKNTFGDFHVLDIGMEQFRYTSDLWKILGKAGFEVLELKNEKLVLKYLKSNAPNQRITSVTKTGWITDNQFICPSFYANETNEHFSLDSKIRNVGFKIKGELKEWQDNICKYCEGNDILTLAICVAFSGTILRFTNQSCTVAHLVGKSSIGKTSALAVAASVWGDSRQFIMQWRVTSNAIETLAESHNECLLILDELSQISARDAGNMIYTLGNAKGKARLNSEAEQKEIRQWQISILSSGEIGIADKISENNEKAKAGQLVRFIDIEAEVPNGFGIYNNLHEFSDGAELSNILKANCEKYHGVPAKIFVESLISANDRDANENNLEESIKHLYELAQRDIYQNFELEKANGQVKRVADVFALYRLAGTLAQRFGIITFDVTKSIYNIFERWVNDRGNKTLSMEENDIVDDVQSFLMQHEARFVRISSVESSYVKDEKVINNCLGGVEDKDNRRIYYVIPKSFQDEICKGKRVKLYRKVLKEKGILLTYEDGSDRRYTINGKRTKMTTLAFTS